MFVVRVNVSDCFEFDWAIDWFGDMTEPFGDLIDSFINDF